MDPLLDFLSSSGEPALRLTLAVVASSLIGWERELGGHPAGLRTNIMVALGAAIFTLLSEDLVAGSQGDPTRVVAGVAQGIGFLGAGTIFLDANKVRGLTSAATIWAVGGLGIAWGAGAYGIGLSGTVAAFVVLRSIKRIESRAAKRPKNRTETREKNTM